MKRLIVASVCLALLAVPAVTLAKAPTASHRTKYTGLYHRTADKLGRRAPGRNIVKDGTVKGPASDADVVRSIGVLQRMLAPPPPPAPVSTPVQSTLTPTTTTTTPAATTTYSAPASSTGGYADVPGVPSSFAACVARTESTNGAGSSNIYGIEGSGGQGSLAEQKQAFSRMYAQRGVNPWQPYDGC